MRAGPDFVWNYDGDLVRQQSYLTLKSQLLNYWTLNLQLNHSEPAMNDRLTRGGPLTASPYPCQSWRVRERTRIRR